MDKNVGKAKTSPIEDRKTLPVFAKYGLIALAVLVVAAVGLIIYLSIAGSYVATVGDEKVGTGEFRYYLELNKQSMYTNALAVNPSLTEETFWNTKISGEDAREVAKKKALDDLKQIKIQLIKAKENKITLTKDELKYIDDHIQSTIIDQMGSGNKIQANKELQKQFGFSIDDLRNAQIEQNMIQKYQTSEAQKITISDDDIKKDYDADPKSYDTVTVRHILFLFAGSDGKRSKEDSKKLADDTLAKINAGEDMTALAEQLSEDPGVTENKGEYVVTKFAGYVPAFKDWALKADVGDTAVVESADSEGYHVMKTEKREPQTFDAVKDQIKNQMILDKFNTDYSAQLDSWKKDAKYNPAINESVYNSIK